MSEDLIKEPDKSELLMGFLKYLIDNPKGAYIKGISEEYDYSFSTVSKVLKTLENEGLVKIEKEGNRKYYRLNKFNFLRSYLQNVGARIVARESVVSHITFSSWIGGPFDHGAIEEGKAGILEFDVFTTLLYEYIKKYLDEEAKKEERRKDRKLKLNFGFDELVKRTFPVFRDSVLSRIKEVYGDVFEEYPDEIKAIYNFFIESTPLEKIVSEDVAEEIITEEGLKEEDLEKIEIEPPEYNEVEYTCDKCEENWTTEELIQEWIDQDRKDYAFDVLKNMKRGKTYLMGFTCPKNLSENKNCDKGTLEKTVLEETTKEEYERLKEKYF